MIFTYSGTGNSSYVAKRIAEITSDTIINMNTRIKADDFSEIETDENIIISVPTYAWRIPRIVTDWLSCTKLKGAKRAWFLMSCGDSIGTAPKYNKKFCEALGLDYMGTVKVEMPENYVAMFKVPKDSTARKIIDNAEPVIDAAGEKIKAGKPFAENKMSIADSVLSGFVNPVFYKLFVKADPFVTTNECTGCGKCAKLCPLNNISIKEGRPQWGKNCTHCMACICRCPSKAIEYGNKSQGKNRYHLD